jgi:hypothetical protein
MKPNHMSKRGLPTHIPCSIHNPRGCALCGAAHGKNLRGETWLAGDSIPVSPPWVKQGSRGEQRRRVIKAELNFA